MRMSFHNQHSFIHLFSKHLFVAYLVPSMMDMGSNSVLGLLELRFGGRKTADAQTNRDLLCQVVMNAK